jgi:hypothetical protein
VEDLVTGKNRINKRNKITEKPNTEGRRGNKIMDVTITRRNKVMDKKYNNGKNIIIKKKLAMSRITGRMGEIITKTLTETWTL